MKPNVQLLLLHLGCLTSCCTHSLFLSCLLNIVPPDALLSNTCLSLRPGHGSPKPHGCCWNGGHVSWTVFPMSLLINQPVSVAPLLHPASPLLHLRLHPTLELSWGDQDLERITISTVGSKITALLIFTKKIRWWKYVGLTFFKLQKEKASAKSEWRPNLNVWPLSYLIQFISCPIVGGLLLNSQLWVPADICRCLMCEFLYSSIWC